MEVFVITSAATLLGVHVQTSSRSKTHIVVCDRQTHARRIALALAIYRKQQGCWPTRDQDMFDRLDKVPLFARNHDLLVEARDLGELERMCWANGFDMLRFDDRAQKRYIGIAEASYTVHADRLEKQFTQLPGA